MEDYLKELIRNLRARGKVLNVSGGREIRVSCPYCKDRHHKHDPKMYISLEPPFLFHCYRCSAAGVLNSKTLADFQVDDPTIIEPMSKAAKSSIRNSGKKRNTSKKIKYAIENKEAAQEALNYFNARYGTNYDLDQADILFERYKLILDSEAFLTMNHAKRMPKFDYTKSIGYLSSDRTYAIFRALYDEEMRYSNVSLSEPKGSKIYTMGTEIDILKEHVEFVIAEGIFDIIGVYEHYYKKLNNTARLFAANCGKTYKSTIEKLFRMGFLDAGITIYSDNDVPIQEYRKMKSEWSLLKNTRITIYYNTIGKDFGVEKSKINLRKVVI